MGIEIGGYGINILLREEIGMFLYTTMGMGLEYGHGNGREWDRKSHSYTSLINSFTWGSLQVVAC